MELDKNVVLSTEKDEGVFNRLVVQYEPFIISIVNQFYKPNGKTPSKNDLIQAGRIGFYNAYLKFDSTKGVRITTFAREYVKNEIRNACLEHQTIGLGEYNVKLAKSINKYRTDYFMEYGEKPSDEELIEYSHGKFSQDILDSYRGISSVSLDDTLNDEESTYYDIVPDNEDIKDNLNLKERENKIKEKINEIMTFLDDEEQKVMSLYIYNEATPCEIAKALKMNVGHVETLINHSLNKIKK